MEIKLCKRCNEYKSLEHFTKNKKQNDGVERYCKNCIKEYRKEHENSLRLLRRIDSNGVKICKICNEEKSLYNFSDHPYTPDGKQSSCKNCYTSIMYEKKWGITLNQYNSLLNSQNFSCAICNKHESESYKKLAVDHDHETGKIRGILCENCNMALGNFKDSIENLQNAINYLQKSTLKSNF